MWVSLWNPLLHPCAADAAFVTGQQPPARVRMLTLFCGAHAHARTVLAVFHPRGHVSSRRRARRCLAPPRPLSFPVSGLRYAEDEPLQQFTRARSVRAPKPVLRVYGVNGVNGVNGGGGGGVNGGGGSGSGSGGAVEERC